MKKLLSIISFFTATLSFSQDGWHVCNIPASSMGRIDDIFMVNTQVGYAAGGNEGRIMKSTDGAENWVTVATDNTVYCRSVEFTNTQKGFVGGFPLAAGTSNILRRTTDGGATWTDQTLLIDPRARKGICGLAAPDSNTIYGCGNWYENAAYIIKSTNGGDSWSFIDMSGYATSLIDMVFINKDIGFAVGKSKMPVEQAIILYTTDGGASWEIKYTGGFRLNEYAWKIQRLTEKIFYVSIQQIAAPTKSLILRSGNGGNTWQLIEISELKTNIQGVGFIDPKRGWAGGDNRISWETKDGGQTWDSIHVCPFMNRVFRLNDTTILASGNQIWKYKGTSLYPVIAPEKTFSLLIHPNPVKGTLTINVALAVPTHMKLMLMDESGRLLRVIDNTDRSKGSYQFYVDTSPIPQGIYYVVMMTHDDIDSRKIVVGK